MFFAAILIEEIGEDLEKLTDIHPNDFACLGQ